MAATAILVRVSPQLKEKIERVAHENDRSVNAEVRRLLDQTYGQTKSTDEEPTGRG